MYSLEVADATADAMMVAMDLVGQAEHGYVLDICLHI
jgi:histidinol dehydrogenase